MKKLKWGEVLLLPDAGSLSAGPALDLLILFVVLSLGLVLEDLVS